MEAPHAQLRYGQVVRVPVAVTQILPIAAPWVHSTFASKSWGKSGQHAKVQG